MVLYQSDVKITERRIGVRMLVVNALPIMAQVVLLVALVRLSRPLEAKNLFHTFFNPASFFTLFATLFFVLPEMYGASHNSYLDGFPDLLLSNPMQDAFVDGAWEFAAFLLFVTLGTAVVRPLTSKRNVDYASEILLKPLTSRQGAILVLFLVVGVAANLVLSVQLRGSNSFRSVLVKSTQGQILTTAVFFGEFAVALLLAHSIAAKKYVAGFAVFALFAASVVLTQSRGRILWPAAIAIILLTARRRRMRYGRLAVAAVVAFTILILLDPLSKYINTGQPIDFSTVLSVNSLFEHRNFDGMSNFVLVSQTGHVHADVHRWLSGANNDFMNTFFPAILAQGVAYGVTVPGWFYMAGGVLGLCAGGAIYGMGLELLNRTIRKVRSPELLVGYLFAISWLAAIGGNVGGSIAKAAANFLPALVYVMLCRKSSQVPARLGPVASSKPMIEVAADK